MGFSDERLPVQSPWWPQRRPTCRPPAPSSSTTTCQVCALLDLVVTLALYLRPDPKPSPAPHPMTDEDLR